MLRSISDVHSSIGRRVFRALSDYLLFQEVIGLEVNPHPALPCLAVHSEAITLATPSRQPPLLGFAVDGLEGLHPPSPLYPPPTRLFR